MILGRYKKDLTGWTYLFTFGYSGDVYGRGDRRVMVERDTGEVIIEYKEELSQGSRN